MKATRWAGLQGQSWSAVARQVANDLEELVEPQSPLTQVPSDQAQLAGASALEGFEVSSRTHGALVGRGFGSGGAAEPALEALRASSEQPPDLGGQQRVTAAEQAEALAWVAQLPARERITRAELVRQLLLYEPPADGSLDAVDAALVEAKAVVLRCVGGTSEQCAAAAQANLGVSRGGRAEEARGDAWEQPAPRASLVSAELSVGGAAAVAGGASGAATLPVSTTLNGGWNTRQVFLMGAQLVGKSVDVWVGTREGELPFECFKVIAYENGHHTVVGATGQPTVMDFRTMRSAAVRLA
jgi:hypothetical protein